MRLLATRSFQSLIINLVLLNKKIVALVAVSEGHRINWTLIFFVMINNFEILFNIGSKFTLDASQFVQLCKWDFNEVAAKVFDSCYFSDISSSFLEEKFSFRPKGDNS